VSGPSVWNNVPDYLRKLTLSTFNSGTNHYECVAPNVEVNLQSGWLWAMSIASFRERFIDFRSCWVVFIHVIQGRPGGLLQFSKGEAVKIYLASDSSCICAMWPNRKRRRAWTVAERCGYSEVTKVCSFGQWAAATCAAPLVSLPVSTPLRIVNRCWPGFPRKWRYINVATFNL